MIVTMMTMPMPNGTSMARSQRRKAEQILRTESDRWIPGKELAARLGLVDTRALRRLVIWPLRTDHRLPIHSRPGVGGGYKLKVTAAEHAACVEWAKQMGRDFMAIMSILSKESLEVVAAQSVMDFMPLVRAEGENAILTEDGLSMVMEAQARLGRPVSWVDVLCHMLDALAERPDEYAAEIEEIRERHGGLFLPAHVTSRLQTHLQAVQDILTQADNPSAPAAQEPCEGSAPTPHEPPRTPPDT